jgi:ATP-dependent RNA circularization protein (DNA/RNA ligase family)
MEVDNIQYGKCYIFPKIDGTNASIWTDNGVIKYGSRNREITPGDDTQGFAAWASAESKIKAFFANNSHLRLYGEWLVPHSLKTYKDTAWRNFYVFDVMDSDNNYLPYDEYKDILDHNNIDYIPPICSIESGTYEQFIIQMQKNVFLLKDGEGIGEGIVIKNYDFVNKFDRVVWAKIVTSEFKEKHSKAMGAPAMKGKQMIEQEIVSEYVTAALCEKTHAKIKNADGWSSKKIPQLLNTVFYDLINEETWNFIKKHKNPRIDFKTLHFLTCKEVKIKLPDVF